MMELRPICRVVSGCDTDTFVGVRAQEGKVEVLFPVGYRLPPEPECRQAIIRLLLVLSDAVKYAKQQGRLEELEMSGLSVDSPIWAYLFLLRLHAETGAYYSEQTTVRVLNGSGITDWRRTLQSRSSTPIRTQAGQWIFPNRVTRNTTRESEGLLTQIHRYCVGKSDELLGWLFGSALSKRERLPAPRLVCIALVRQAMERTHYDAEKDLFRAMLSVLGEEDRTQVEQKRTYGTCKFDIAWEMLVRGVFGNVKEKEFYPASRWYVGSSEIPSSSLRPDSILNDREQYYVLDAKYYHLTDGDLPPLHAPPTTDVNKQLAYAEYVWQMTDKSVVYNAFLLPCDSAAEPMVAEGWNVPDWKHHELKGLSDNDSKRYAIVSAIRLDTAWLMDFYAKHPTGTTEYRRRLAQMIQANYSRALADFRQRHASP